jgi:hypothetical protein
MGSSAFPIASRKRFELTSSNNFKAFPSNKAFLEVPAVPDCKSFHTQERYFMAGCKTLQWLGPFNGCSVQKDRFAVVTAMGQKVFFLLMERMGIEEIPIEREESNEKI